MRYFLVAGEASGDNLGALLIEEILLLDPRAEFMFWGGDAMQAASGGLAPKRHIRELAFMGFAEVARNLLTVLRLMREAKRQVAAFAPDTLVCIDYPGFNLRLGAWAKRRGVWVDMYVSPQIWAWRQGRVHRVIRDTNRVLCVLPFEVEFYARFGYAVTYAGHPLPKRVDRFSVSETLTVQDSEGARAAVGEVVALLPGSRLQEVRELLPVMLRACAKTGDRLPVIGAAPVLTDEELRGLSEEFGVGWTRDTYDLLGHAHTACVSSGTATLETALFGVPQVVCYRGGRISVAVARRLVKVPYIALVNLILGEQILPELIQGELTPASLAERLSEISAGPARELQLAGYGKLRERLLPYDAAATAAKFIVTRAQSADRAMNQA